MGNYTEHLITQAGGDGDEGAAFQVTVCEAHHWVSTNVPGLHGRWVIQCSICGVYNVEDMNAALSAAGFTPVNEASEKALTEAAEEIDRLRMIGKTPYTECSDYEARAWWAFAEVKPEDWLRARASELSKP